MAHPAYYSSPPPALNYYSRQTSPKRYAVRRSSSQSDCDEDTANLFSDQSIRRGFIRKVYGILTVQLMFTLGVISLFIFSETGQEVCGGKPMGIHLFYCAFPGDVLNVSLLRIMRQTPRNYVCLGVLTIALSYMTGALSSRYDTDIVFLTVAITAAVTLALTIFAIQTKLDFTMCSGFLCMASIVVIMLGLAFSLAFMVIGYNKIMNIVYAGLAAFLFCLYLVYDTQLLLGGRRYSLSEEEYILASIQLYLDIVMLFTYLLQIVNLAKN